MKRLRMLLIMLILLIVPFGVKATAYDANRYSSSLYNSCVNEGKCILLCAYENAMYDDKYGSSYIYYKYDGTTLIEWYGYSQTKGNDKHYSVSDKFKKVFFSTNAEKFKSDGTCPKFSYIDVDAWGGSNELCFDYGDYCISKDPGKLFTTFKGESEKKYDYTKEIDTYFNSWAPTINSCEDLRNKNFDISDQLNEDFKKNYLNGNEIPGFMLKNPHYVNGFESLKEKYTNFTNECNAEIDEKVLNNEITESEGDKLKDQNNEGLEQAINEVDDVVNKFDYTPGEEVYGCEIVPEVVKKWIKLAANFVKYVALVLVIVLGTIDFIKAAGSGEPDAIKKAGQSFLKRVIAVIILFLLPMLIELILNLINLYGSNNDCFDVLK